MTTRRRAKSLRHRALVVVAGLVCGLSVSCAAPSPAGVASEPPATQRAGAPPGPTVSASATPTPSTASRPATGPAASRPATTVARVESSHPEVLPTTSTRSTHATFASSVRLLTAEERAAMTGVTWHAGCPVPLGDLRRVEVSYWSFDGDVRRGALVVNADVADNTVEAFRGLFDIRFPIRRMTPIEAYGGDDYASIEADNTSAFNCRPETGKKTWSQHAYGRAIDVNPLENPYVFRDGTTSHPASRTYLNRKKVRPGMIVEGSAALRAFDAAGWSWGGRWNPPVDYQHFAIS